MDTHKHTVTHSPRLNTWCHMCCHGNCERLTCPLGLQHSPFCVCLCVCVCVCVCVCSFLISLSLFPFYKFSSTCLSSSSLSRSIHCQVIVRSGGKMRRLSATDENLSPSLSLSSLHLSPSLSISHVSCLLPSPDLSFLKLSCLQLSLSTWKLHQI